MTPPTTSDEFDRLISTESLLQQPDLVLRLLEFLGLAYDASFLRDVQGVITTWNAGAAGFYGWRAEEAIGRVSHDLLQTQFPPLTLPIDALLLQEGRWEGELVHRRRDGMSVDVESRQVVLRDGAGQPVSILETNRDISQRRRGQAARAQLAAIVESSDDAIVGETLDATITSWNQGAERLYGYTAEEAIGRPMAILVPPDRPDELPAMMTRLRRGERIDQYETERITKDGRRLQVSVTISPIKDASGRIVGASAVARDVTGRRQLERELQVSRDQLQAVLESTADGILVQDPAGAIVYANDAAAQLCGFPSAEALCAAPIADVLQGFELLDADGNPFPPDALAARQALRTGRPAESLVRSRTRRGGDERWAITRARPVLDGEGRVAFAVSAFQDVSAVKQEELRQRFLGAASAVLAESLDLDATLTRVADLAVPQLADWATVDLLDPDGSIRRVALAHRDPAKIQWAQELERRYPTDPEATSGVPQVIRSGRAEFFAEIPQELIDAASLDDEARKILEELDLTSFLIVPLQTGAKTLGAISLVYAESKRHYSESDLALARELAARAALAVENARLYRDALAAVHVRDEFLSSVSHDLRTPLTTIRGSAQLARRMLARAAPAGGARTLEAVGNIDEAAARMEKMIAGLLDLARLESGRPVDIDPQWMDLVPLLQDLVLQHRRGAPECDLQLELPVPQVTGVWDALRLERVVDNLLSNAIKYSPARSAIRVTLSVEADAAGAAWARLDVEDHGIGIPAADLPQIFERFHRAANVPARTPGIGIGLAGARQIAELHQGMLTVESKEGDGSRFTLKLPITTNAPEET